MGDPLKDLANQTANQAKEQAGEMVKRAFKSVLKSILTAILPILPIILIFIIFIIILVGIFGMEEAEAGVGEYSYDYVVIDGVAGQIFNFLLEKGVSPEGAVAILGNIERESSFNPVATNGTHNGLCQWKVGGRFDSLLNFAGEKDWRDVDVQLNYMWSELEGAYNGVLAEIKNATSESDIEYATWYWGRFFEVYFTGNYDSTRNGEEQQKRYKAALKWYEIYKTASMNNGGEAVSRGNDSRVIDKFKSNITGRTFATFNQCAINGWSDKCNRAAQIAICSGYWTKSYDDLINSANSICPNNENLYNQCGLTCKILSESNFKNRTLSANLIKKQMVENKGYIIVYLRGKNVGASGISKYGNKWASSMHWVSIIGYQEKNGQEQIYVSDSGHHQTGWHPIDEFNGMIQHVTFVNEK